MDRGEAWRFGRGQRQADVPCFPRGQGRSRPAPGAGSLGGPAGRRFGPFKREVTGLIQGRAMSRTPLCMRFSSLSASALPEIGGFGGIVL